jgi:hypothetical protein
MGAEFLHANRRKDIKLNVAFRSFASAFKNEIECRLKSQK